MYRHYQWLQAIDNGSHLKTAFSNDDVEKATDGFFNRLLIIRRQHNPELGGIRRMLVGVIHRRLEQQAVAVAEFPTGCEIQFRTPVSAP